MRFYRLLSPFNPDSVEVLRDIDGVVGYACWDTSISLHYDLAEITPEQLDQQVIATGFAVPNCD